MRLGQSKSAAILLLVPALHVLAASVALDTADKPLARAPLPAYGEDAEDVAIPEPSVSPSSPSSKGTKDAPVDGFDGKPHAGPYIDDTPTSHGKQPNIVEELQPGASSSKDSTTLVEEEGILDGDKSVMQDPERKPATGNTGIEGGVSAKDKERLEHEEKTGEKMEKVPESPKEPQPLSHADQQQLEEDTETTSSTRALGAVGLEVCINLPLNVFAINRKAETHRSP